MSEDVEKNRVTSGTEAEVKGAIEVFQHVLQVVPNDLSALRAIFNAYEELGERGHAATYLAQLVGALEDQLDRDALGKLLPKIKEFAGEGFEVLSGAAQRIDELLSEPGPDGVQPGEILPQAASSDRKPGASASAVSSVFDMAAEMAFAWELLEAGDLTQDEYASVVQDLTDMSASGGAETVSVLHVLEARKHKGLGRVLGRIAEACSTPVVSLSHFDLQSSVGPLLPMGFMLQRGALVFEKIGESFLVAILNPYDQKVRRDVEMLLGSPCHFYLAPPAEFDQALTRLSEVEAVKTVSPAAE